ncbi:unnamed protein product [Phaeothamnion confervicola]
MVLLLFNTPTIVFRPSTGLRNQPNYFKGDSEPRAPKPIPILAHEIASETTLLANVDKFSEYLPDGRVLDSTATPAGSGDGCISGCMTSPPPITMSGRSDDGGSVEAPVDDSAATSADDCSSASSGGGGMASWCVDFGKVMIWACNRYSVPCDGLSKGRSRSQIQHLHV